MQLISSFLFGLSANADNFVIGVSYGLKKVHIPAATTLLIGLITALGTFFSIGLGGEVGTWIPKNLALFLGSGFLILLGVYYLMKTFFKKEQTTQQSADVLLSVPACISWKEALSIATALTLNNMGMGIGASISGIPLLSTTLISFLFSVLFLSLGNHLGKSRLCCVFSRFSEPLSGLLMILLGIYEWICH